MGGFGVMSGEPDVCTGRLERVVGSRARGFHAAPGVACSPPHVLSTQGRGAVHPGRSHIQRQSVHSRVMQTARG